jgi:hypothetical protein
MVRFRTACVAAGAATQMLVQLGGAFMARKKSKPVEPVTPVRPDASPETGSAAGGQAGDLQGLSGEEDVQNESVRELVEEGQYYEASIVDAVENAPPPEAGPLRPHGREPAMPPEYEPDPDEPKE